MPRFDATFDNTAKMTCSNRILIIDPMLFQFKRRHFVPNFRIENAHWSQTPFPHAQSTRDNDYAEPILFRRKATHGHDDWYRMELVKVLPATVSWWLLGRWHEVEIHIRSCVVKRIW